MLATLDTSRFVDFLKRLCSRSPALLQYAIYHQMYLSSRNLTREGGQIFQNIYIYIFMYTLIWNNNHDNNKKEINKRIGEKNLRKSSLRNYISHTGFNFETGRDPTGICEEAIRGEWRE